MKRQLVCIVCPMGCNITVNTDTMEITGNNCVRGKEYAYSECTAPVRIITTTVKTKEGKVIPVKTISPIPKEKIYDCMKIINSTNPVLPIKAGDVIIKDMYGSDVVATVNAD